MTDQMQQAWTRVAADLPRADLIASLLRVGLILLLLWIALRALQTSGDRFLPGANSRLRTIRTLVRSTMRYGAIGLAVTMILEELGINPAALVAGIGVIGVMIGLGTQTLVRDVVGGIFILLEDQFEVGDTVTIGTFTGTVTELGLRATRLVDDGGNVHILPNGDIRAVTRRAKAQVQVSIDITFPDTRGLDEARKLMTPVAEYYSAEVEGPVALTHDNFTLRLVARVPPTEAAATEVGMREALRRALERTSEGTL